MFPGALPLREAASGLEDLARHWSGGKASALYETCQQLEDQAAAEDLLAAVARAARTDVPDAPLEGLGVLERRSE